MRRKCFKHVISRTMAVTLSAVLLVLPAIPARAVSAGTGNTRTGNVETYDSIDGLSGEVLYDTDGNRVYACGGEVHQVEENGGITYYWFGVDDLDAGPGWQNNHPGIHLYSSQDLYNWKYEGVMYKEEGELYAHPKMLYNGEEYVMWVSTGTGSAGEGEMTGCGTTKVLSSKNIKGPFTPVENQPDALGAAFINLYEEKPGDAYLIHYGNASDSAGTAGIPGQGTICKTRLSPDYKTLAGETKPFTFSGDPLTNTEGGIFKQNGRYYIVNAGMNEYASAYSLDGTWTKHSLQMWDGCTKKDIDSKNQTSDVFRVRKGDSDLWVCVGDSVNGGSETRYKWLPVSFFDDGTIALWELSNWKLGDIGGVPPEEPDEPGNYGDIPGLSGRILYDTDGNKIYACGGEVHEIEENGQKKWYWFGVDDLNPEKANEHPGIHLYSSSDLYNWNYEGVMLNEDGITYAHPKVLFNGTEYVMWVPYMSSVTEGDPAPAPVGGVKVATSKSIKGPFTVVPDSSAVDDYGFVNLYEESRGNAWLIYTDYSTAGGSSSLFRVKLNHDYTGTVGEAEPFQFASEGLTNAEGGIFKKDGTYYIVNSGMGEYAVADSFEGVWEKKEFKMWDGTGYKDIQLPNQTSSVFHVKTEEADTYVCIGDSVGGTMDGTPPAPVCYIWLPVEFFGDGAIALKEERNWTIAGMEPPTPEATPEGTPAPTPEATPEATEKPEETAKPESTPVPTPEATPVATPKATEKLEETAKPEGTPAPTPKATEKPEETAKPEGTPAPTPEATPKATEKPEETGKPESTPAPTPEATPVEPPKATEKPEETAKPEGTPAPTPKATEKPEETAKPESTPKASEKPESTPKVTEKPEETAKPESTPVATPKATEKPEETAKPVETQNPVEVKSVLVAAKKLTLGVGEKIRLEAAAYPENAADRKLTYTASNTKVSVSADGKITAKKQGVCIITISAPNGKKAVVKVTVKKKPGKITLNPRKKTLKTGKKFKIKVRLPKGTASRTLTYVSSKPGIADVSAEGKVTAKKKGYAVITVKTYNGKKASLKIHVK